MIDVKKMSGREKYCQVLKCIERDYVYIPSFLKKHLGNRAAIEIRDIWQKGSELVPEDISLETQYRIAYGNWIWIAQNTYSFIRRQLGEAGISQFERAEVEELKQRSSGLSMFIFNLVKLISPGSAFSMIAKQLAYQMQWLTPFSISELSRNRLVIDIPRCKILDFPNSHDLCLIGCQSTYSIWLAEQFRVSMQTELHGAGCTKTVTPL